MSPRPLLGLAGLAAVLVALLFLEYQGAGSEDVPLPPLSRRPAAVEAGAPPPPPGNLQAQVDAILARPLFRIGRRPPLAGVAQTAAAPVPLPRLTAVLVSGTRKSLIFAGGTDGKPVVVPEGGRIGLYVVQSIGAGQATLLGPEGARTVRPSFGAAPGGAPGAAAVQASAPVQPSILDLLRNGPPASVGIPGLPSPLTQGGPGTRP